MRARPHRHCPGGTGLLIALALAACGGEFSGTAPTGGGSGPGGIPGGGARSMEQLFDDDVRPRLAFCRSCHVADGIADTDDGRDFLLRADGMQDLEHLYDSWARLGGNDPTSRILLMASGQETPHSGGSPWPQGSDAYRAMALLLDCFEHPDDCTVDFDGAPVSEHPLLTEGPRGGGPWSNFCTDRPDDAALPADPRTLVVPGVNEGKAVNFNAFWRECPNPVEKPQTCGEWRAMVAAGEVTGLGHGAPRSATAFGADLSNPSLSISAAQYNRLWEAWGLPGRPEAFDRLVAERYGSAQSPERNPYPLPGEDPNATDGGSGQLPMVFTQLRQDDGAWTGRIGVKVCSFCHSGQLGTTADGPGLGPQIGGAGSIGDFTVAATDFTQVGATAWAALGGPTGLTIATNRGSGAIDFFQLAFVLFANGDPLAIPLRETLFSQAIGNIKSPPWWNMAYRPHKFHSAVLPMDSVRIAMAAYYPLFPLQPEYSPLGGENPIDWVDEVAVQWSLWAETLAPPPFPGPIDTGLAEQGAILFHSKDLWAANLDNPKPRPESGNGSCASCHGVYSPRFAHDPAFLETPELKGIAAYTVPLSVIGTDPVYAEALESLKQPDGSTNPAIMRNDFLYCGLGEVGESTTPKMLAPPLWGIWAAAPYFHNASVPDIAGVLGPREERPRIWRRISAPPPPGLEGQVVMGYDTDLDRAYDFDRLGWKYEELRCGEPGTGAHTTCDPNNPEQAALLEQVLGELYTNIAILWNLPRLDDVFMTNERIEQRKIFNTYEYSQGNQGHEFTTVLTDQERRAIIEYLKTL